MEDRYDSVPISIIEKWLWQIAINNTSNALGSSCEELINRLDGLRKFNEEYQNSLHFEGD